MKDLTLREAVDFFARYYNYDGACESGCPYFRAGVDDCRCVAPWGSEKCLGRLDEEDLEEIEKNVRGGKE